MPQRKMQPPKGYMTARRAKQLLGNISDGMLRTYITRGLIERLVPDTRSQGFYKTEDVSNLAQRLGVNRTIRFSQGTIDDLAECDELLARIFGGSNPVDASGKPIAANPIERRASWVTKNPETVFILRAGTELVGCVFMLPLSQEMVRRILESEKTPAIYAEDVQSFTPGVPTHLYVMSACVYASDHTIATKRFYGSRLIHGLLSKIVELGKRGIDLQTIVSRSESKDGIALLRHVGCTEIESTTHWRNFLIDVSLSGIPDVMRYKRALQAYRQEYHVSEAPQPLYRFKTDALEAEQKHATPAPRRTASPDQHSIWSQERIDASAQPEGTITLIELADLLKVSRTTLVIHMRKWDEKPDDYPQFEHTAIPVPNRPKEKKRYFTAEQVEAVRQALGK